MQLFSVKKFIVSVILVSIVAYLTFIAAITMPGPLSSSATVIIPPATPLSKIATILHRQKAIYSKKLFVAYSYFTQSQGYLRSGEYRIPARADLASVVKIMRQGSNITYKITAIEGKRTTDIIELVNTHPKLSGAKVTTLYPEGSLAPNTYLFKYGDTKETLIANMHQAMQQIRVNIARELPPLTAQYPMMKSVDDVITLASIVEMEARFEEERPLIAAVFLNRLKKNMPLQADPTVVYAIETSSDRRNFTLSKQDLKFNSPYNTYFNKGLPPGPISCPGNKAINAVLSPANVKHLYFVSNNNGGHNFSSNLVEHNKNVRLYRKANKTKNKAGS